MDINNLRITKIKEYLVDVIKSISSITKFKVNANMLSNNINNYSLDKIPTSSEVERWITGDIIHRDVYSFRSRMAYSQDMINNLKNIGFFETFENKIKSNNRKGILPNIDEIETIECLNCGTMVSAGTSTAEFDIQIEVKYREV